MLVKEYFELDNGATKKTLEAMIQGDYITRPNGRGYGFVRLDEGSLKMDPYYVSEWTKNPIEYILSDDELWALFIHCYAKVTKKTVTMSSVCDSLLICGFYILDNRKGPEGDGARQMMRKHWYAWLKSPLQKLAIRLGKALMENGTPDSESLNALISKRVGEWNEKGLLEYRQVWIENNTTKFLVNPNALSEYNIVICCEKDAAFAGVCLSGIAMGALAVYSGGGKSSRAGIEKLYYACLKDRLRYSERLIVLTISDYDTDGESVIAPTFTEQLSTYIDRNRIDSIRVGVDPDQLVEFNYLWADKEYEVKYNVGDGMAKNYLIWCAQKAVFYYECENCGNGGPHVGGVCESCGYAHLPENVPLDKGELALWKEEYIRFYQQNSPKGFELDALTRVDYCSLLVKGLTDIIDFGEYVENLSQKMQVSPYSVGYDLTERILSENTSYQEIDAYSNKLQEWFRGMTELLDQRRREIREDIRSEMQDLAEALSGDERVFQDDPRVDIGDLIRHMENARFNLGRCEYCYRPVDQCVDPEGHKRRGYHKDVPESELFEGVESFQPFSAQDREANLLEIVQDDHFDRIEELKRTTFDYPTVNIDMGDNEEE
jgi:hypothetical protein